MKKNLFIGALAVFALTACSQDEVVDVNNYGNEIGFSAVANKGSRAKVLFCNANLPTTINVSAYTTSGANLYFKDTDYTSNGTNYTTTFQRFWPESDALTFLATAGATLTKNQTSGKCEEYFNYTVNKVVAEQEDVLYAVTGNATKDNMTNGICPLNFRHALSQIVFKAKNTSNNLYVKIEGVSIHNVNNSGTFTYSSDTQTNWTTHETNPNHNEDVTDGVQNNNDKGAWASLSSVTTDTDDGYQSNDYLVSWNTAVELGLNVSENLTDVVKISDSYPTENKLAMLLMPQSNNDIAKGTTVQIMVKCQVYNIADTSEGYQEGVDVAIFGKNGAENLVIDLNTFQWQSGCKYIYTINFGGNEGGKDEDGNDVFVPIKYSVTVDDFDVVSDTEQNVNPAP